MNNSTFDNAKPAYVITDGWAGRMEWAVMVIGETPKRYRVQAMVEIKLPSRRLKFGDKALIPKHAVRFT